MIGLIDRGYVHKGKMASAPVSLPLCFFHLAHLLEAGVSIGDSLADVELQESRTRLGYVWKDVRMQIEQGKKFSDAMSIWPGVFEPLVISLIRAGEANGSLAAACDDVQALLLWQRGVKSRITTVLVYPCFALLIMLAAIAFLFVSVVPAMQVFLVDTQDSIAWHTAAILYLSAWLSEFLLPILCILALVAFVVLALRAYLPPVRMSCDRLQLQIPLIGCLLTELSLSRYAKICGRLYRSGLSLDEALEVSEGVVGNRTLRSELRGVRQRVLSGTSLGMSVQAARFVPSTFKKLLVAGESTATLEQAFVQASNHLLRSSEHKIDRMEKLIGPLLLMIVGLNLLWIVVSIMAPVYDAAIATVIAL